MYKGAKEFFWGDQEYKKHIEDLTKAKRGLQRNATLYIYSLFS
jgi:hypothetical protein